MQHAARLVHLAFVTFSFVWANTSLFLFVIDIIITILESDFFCLIFLFVC